MYFRVFVIAAEVEIEVVIIFAIAVGVFAIAVGVITIKEIFVTVATTSIGFAMPALLIPASFPPVGLLLLTVLWIVVALVWVIFRIADFAGVGASHPHELGVLVTFSLSCPDSTEPFVVLTPVSISFGFGVIGLATFATRFLAVLVGVGYYGFGIGTGALVGIPPCLTGGRQIHTHLDGNRKGLVGGGFYDFNDLQGGILTEPFPSKKFAVLFLGQVFP